MARTPLSLPFNGRRLRHWRERYGLTQKELADSCGLSRSQISRWELGDAKPAPAALIQLVDGLAELGIGLADLLDKRMPSPVGDAPVSAPSNGVP